MPAPASAAVTPSAVLAVSRTHCRYMQLFFLLTGFSSLFLRNLLQNSPLCILMETERAVEALLVPQPWHRRVVHIYVSKTKLLSLKSKFESLAEGATGQGWGVQPEPDSKTSALQPEQCQGGLAAEGGCRSILHARPCSSSTCPRAISEASPRNSLA